MIVFKRVPFSFLFRLNKWYILYIVIISAITWRLSEVLHIENPTILLPSMAVFGTVLSIVLAFRTNEAYNRWWEARTLWGALINTSRSFAREILTYLNVSNTSLSVEKLDQEKQKFIYRHLAYVNALRIHLRQQDTFEEELKPFLENEDLSKVRTYRNVPTQLVLNQSNRLNKIYKSEKLNGFEFVQLNKTLNNLYDIQGGCERIKFTIFPRLYTYYTTSFTWFFSTLLIITLVDEFEWQSLIVRALVAYVFLVVNHLGTDLKNPFENKMSDTPMSALCRTIEIDLRQMLGEKDLPSPVKPENGILN